MKITTIQWVWIVLGSMILLGMCSNNPQSTSKSEMKATQTVATTKFIAPTSTVASVTETKAITKTVEVITIIPTKLVENAQAMPTEIIPTEIPIVPATFVVEDKSAAPCNTGQIKGSQNGIYHLPGGRDYKRTKKNVTCFDTIEAAQSAGFVPSENP